LASRGSRRLPPASISLASPLRLSIRRRIQAIGADIDPLDQQRNNACLLGREEFVPRRVELLQGGSGVGLGDLGAVRAPPSMAPADRCLGRPPDTMRFDDRSADRKPYVDSHSKCDTGYIRIRHGNEIQPPQS
jgi:hypothetical protein